MLGEAVIFSTFTAFPDDDRRFKSSSLEDNVRLLDVADSRVKLRGEP